MTSGEDDMDPKDDAIEALLPQALEGELIPTTEAEVLRAEAAGIEFEGVLPDALREFQPAPPVVAAAPSSPPQRDLGGSAEDPDADDSDADGPDAADDVDDSDADDAREADDSDNPDAEDSDDDDAREADDSDNPDAEDSDDDDVGEADDSDEADDDLDAARERFDADDSDDDVGHVRERFDADDDSVAPESLADVVPLSRRRRATPWLTHVAAAALGAAAVATLVIGRGEPTATPGGAPSHTPEPPAVPDAAPDAAPKVVTLPAPAACGPGCCAGKKCKTATPELAECASGRSCIPCTLTDLGATRFRVKLGALAPLNAGRAAMDRAAPGSVEVCVRAGGSAEVCVPAHASASADAPWSSLPLVISAQDLLAALIVRVRQRGVATPLAEWQSPVPVSPTVLCRGLSVKPMTPKAEAFGVVSLFLDDTHYVEAARGAAVAALAATAARIQGGALKAKIFQTRRGGDQRFALVYGPISHAEAEKLRWALLEGGQDARVTLGEDHEGDPRP